MMLVSIDIRSSLAISFRRFRFNGLLYEQVDSHRKHRRTFRQTTVNEMIDYIRYVRTRAKGRHPEGCSDRTEGAGGGGYGVPPLGTGTGNPKTSAVIPYRIQYGTVRYFFTYFVRVGCPATPV